jgi:signal transduction histidine kinase
MATWDTPEHLALLREVASFARALAGTLDLEILLRRITEAARALRPDALCALRLLDDRARGYRLVAASGPYSETLAPLVPFGVGLTDAVARTREARAVNDVRAETAAASAAWAGEQVLGGYYGVPLEARGTLVGVLSMRHPSARPPSAEEREAIQLLASHAAVAITNARLYGASERRRRAAETLAEMGRLLSQALDPDVLAQVVADRLQPLLDARSSAVYRLMPDGSLESLAVAGELAACFDRKHVVPAGVGALGLAVRERRSIVTGNLLADARIFVPPGGRERVEPSAHRAALATPLVAKDVLIGGLVVGDVEGRVFDAEDVHLAEAFAAHAAVALDNARLFAEAQRRRREAEIVADIARAINSAHPLDAILARILEGARALCEAAFAAMSTRTPESGAMRISRVVGLDAGEEGWEDPARLERALLEPGRSISFITAPVVVDDRVEGMLYTGDRGTREFTGRARAQLAQLADHAAIAIRKEQIETERVEALRREHEARATAERRQERLGFLADASTVLALSLDYSETLRSIAQLAVPWFSDWCAVDVLEETGTIQRLAVAHADPARVRLARMLQTRYPLDPDAAMGPAKVIRTGSTEFYPEVPDGLLSAYAQEDEHLRQLRALGLRSGMVVPLTARGRVLGAICFARAESTVPYDRPDVAIAEDLARRAALAMDNARLYQAAQDADRHKGEFLTILAHELRGPLASIRAAARRVGRRAGGDGEVADAVAAIDRQVRHQARLLDDLLDLSRVSRGAIELRKTAAPLGAIVADSLEGVRGLVEERGHRVSVSLPSDPLVVHVDATRLTQVLVNLLANAAKYTPAGGRIAVSAEPEGHDVVLRVRDTGLGIPRDMLSRVFDLFAQVETHRSGARGGLGIGLTLVRRLVELHGGTVSAASEGPGRGSEFVVRLPLRGAPPAPPVPPMPRGPAGPRRILLVEDDDDTRAMLRAALELEGHTVEVAADGVAALARAVEWRPEVALVDIGLPGLDGYEVARRMRERLGPGVRLVALTGHGQMQDRLRAMEAGFDAHLIKPFEFDELERALGA